MHAVRLAKQLGKTVSFDINFRQPLWAVPEDAKAAVAEAMALAGIPTVDSLGVDGGKIHSPQEFAYIESLVDCAKRLVATAIHI